MSFNVKIKNYQRLKQVNLDFPAGVTLITGESNNGKSSIFRAIRSACFNSPNESHIRNGCNKTLVSLNYNGHTIKYCRDKSKASQVVYEIDGELYSKLGRNNLDLIGDLLGIRNIEIDDLTIPINFHKQMDYPFSLDKTPSQLYKLFTQSVGGYDLFDILNDIKTDRNELNNDLSVEEKFRERCNESKIKAEGDYEIIKNQSKTADKILDLDNQLKDYESLKQLSDGYNESLLNVNSLGDEVSDLDLKVKGCALLKDSIISLYNKLDAISKYLICLDSVNSLNKEIKSINSKLDLIDTDLLDKELSDLINEDSKYYDLSTKLKGLNKCTAIYEALQSEVSEISEYTVNLGLDRDLELITNISKYLIQKAQISEFKKDIQKTTKDLTALQKELDEIGICPTCMRPLKDVGEN